MCEKMKKPATSDSSLDWTVFQKMRLKEGTLLWLLDIHFIEKDLREKRV